MSYQNPKYYEGLQYNEYKLYVEIEQVKFFKKIIKLLKSFHSHITLRFSFDKKNINDSKIYSMVCDRNNARAVFINIPSTNLKKFHCNVPEFEISLKSNKFHNELSSMDDNLPIKLYILNYKIIANVLNKLSLLPIVLINIIAEYIFENESLMYLKNNNKSVLLTLLNTHLPLHKFSATVDNKVVFPSVKFIDVMKQMRTISEYILFETNNTDLTFRNDVMTKTFNNIVHKYDDKKSMNIKNVYEIKYLQSEIIKLNENITLYLANNYPLIMEVELNNFAKIWLLISPCQSEENNINEDDLI